MTGKELACLLDISQQQISRYECGVCNITVDNLIIILDILNVSVDEFFKKVYLNVFDSEEPEAKKFFNPFVLMDN
ncbi:helix-turn-helix domain-containing protein [Providencia sneebia]